MSCNECDGAGLVLVSRDDNTWRQCACVAPPHEPGPGRKWDRVAAAVAAEARMSGRRWGDAASGHEVYGVLAEELAEFFESVRRDRPDAGELIQIAAVAMRAAEQILDKRGWEREGGYDGFPGS